MKRCLKNFKGRIEALEKQIPVFAETEKVRRIKEECRRLIKRFEKTLDSLSSSQVWAFSSLFGWNWDEISAKDVVAALRRDEKQAFFDHLERRNGALDVATDEMLGCFFKQCKIAEEQVKRVFKEIHKILITEVLDETRESLRSRGAGPWEEFNLDVRSYDYWAGKEGPVELRKFGPTELSQQEVTQKLKECYERLKKKYKLCTCT